MVRHNSICLLLSESGAILFEVRAFKHFAFTIAISYHINCMFYKEEFVIFKSPNNPRKMLAFYYIHFVTMQVKLNFTLELLLTASFSSTYNYFAATISFANYKPKLKDQRQKIPLAEQIQKIFHLDAIPIPTVTVPVRIDCDYSNLCSKCFCYDPDSLFNL